MMTEAQVEEQAANLKAVTDRLDILDALIKSEGIGQPKVMAFRCTHSGKLFPADFAKEWGKTTGIGLGPEIVSECLDSMYHVPPPKVETVKRPEHIMHPMQSTRAQLDLVTVLKSEYEANKLILHRDDPDFAQRAEILRQNQMNKPGSVIAAYYSEYFRIMKGGAK